MDDVRSMMRGKKAMMAKKKVRHPMARYGASGNLICVLCNTVIKSENLWQAHLLGKRHRDLAAALKAGKSIPEPQVSG